MDIHDSKLTLRVRSEEITFGVNQATKSSQVSNDKMFFMDGMDEVMELVLRWHKKKEMRKMMIL